jgi:hypothetical protein
VTFTITKPPGGGASLLGATGPLGQDNLLAINAGEALPVQEVHASAKAPAADAGSTTPLVVSTASSQAGQAANGDWYWQSLSGSNGDRIMDANDWAVHELTLALEGV